MGNTYPAHAKDADEWDQGYAAGHAITACLYYAEGTISQPRFIEDLRRAQSYLSDRQADGLITGFLASSNSNGSEGAKRALRKCYSASKHLLNNFNSSYGSIY